MASFDLLLTGGTLIDGTGAPRRVADVGVTGGRIAAVGDLAGAQAKRVIDARNLIVAPGVIDSHTHYDAQIHWDPYCTSSGWNGMTSAVISNCGFGYAPARPDMQVRYMRMMVNTEQVPYEAQAAGLSWGWETFPEWMAHLRRIPKGINLGVYLPMNPLLCYVMGAEEAKRRTATPDERRRMRELLHEAMDAGAIGFSFSYLGVEGNSHVDYDQSPMPTDVMAEEEAFDLCDVLRERGQGVVQLLADMPAAGAPKRAFCEALARRSGRPVIHNVTVVAPGHPELHGATLDWLDDCALRGLDIWTQLGTGRVWFEFNLMDYNGWDSIPVFRALGAPPTPEGRLEIVRSPEYRERLRREYDPFKMLETGSTLENYYLHDVGRAAAFAAEQGRQLGDIARDRGVCITDLFLDLLSESALTAEFRVENVTSHDAQETADVLRHPKVIAGLSDGGAHGKFTSGGQWGVDLIMWLVRENRALELEELHQILSDRTCRAFGFEDRGTIEVGKAADLFVYDLDALGFDRGRFEVLHDLPGGEWRRAARARGVSHMIVGGEVTFDHEHCTGATPGRLLRNASVRAVQLGGVAAE